MEKQTLQLKQVQYLDKVAVLKIFTPEQCAKIIDNGLNNWKKIQAYVQQNTVEKKQEQNFVENLDYRNTTVFSPHEPDEWLFSTILGHIKKFNDSEEGYQFDISGMIESPNMMKYSSPDISSNGKPGKYDWHMDVGVGLTPCLRKLSYSILLNAGEYEGGELTFHTGRTTKPDPGQTSSDYVGAAFVFPSYLVHRVLEVTKGTRYALCGWIHGNSFT